eukprot:525415-Pleurochrysis_carterae.AAC.3
MTPNEPHRSRRRGSLGDGPQGVACGCLPHWHPWRVRAYAIVSHTAFERSVLIIIIVNCAYLALQGEGVAAKVLHANQRAYGHAVVCV